MKARISALALLVLVSCGEKKPTPPPTPPVGTVHHKAPVTVAVEGPSAVHAGDVITLSVTVHRYTDDVIDLAISLPPGNTLVEGLASERLLAAESITTRVFRVKSDAAAEDIKITAAITTAGHGALATTAYRFGRPEPKLPPAPRPVARLNGGPPLPR